MYISLSSSYASKACAVRQSINNYTTQYGPSQFFDWLITSMKSVNQLLEGTPILFEETYIYPNPLNTTSINFLNFDLLTSHHDIDIFNETSITDITAKYTRRYERLISIIKGQGPIYFIRYCMSSIDIDASEIEKFHINIKRINPVLVFKFILISDCIDLVMPICLLSFDNFIYIDLNKYLDDDIINESNPYFQNIKKYKCVFNIIK